MSSLYSQSHNQPTDELRAHARIQRAFNPIEDGNTTRYALTSSPVEITLEKGSSYKFYGSVKFHLVFAATANAAVDTAHPHVDHFDSFYFSLKHERASAVKFTDEDDGYLWVTKQVEK